MAGRRRGKGEGSIYRRKEGRWVGQYEVNGKRRYIYARTRKEVAEKLNRAGYTHVHLFITEVTRDLFYR